MKLRYLALALSLAVLPTGLDARNSFAIIVDETTYSNCRTELEMYRDAVKFYNGLDAFVSPADWKDPEMVRDSIRTWYAWRSLEGVVLVGDIPIPMIRQAQFLTSAFKMDETAARRDSSVPSDRFYDDFGLKFDFVARDTVETSFFYYNLSGEGDQEIKCDIYSARIKPSSDWRDPYEELSDYLFKLVSVKAESGNRFDKISSYTGEGSFSNSMVAWRDECRTLSEQAPEAFRDLDGTRFYVFHQKAHMKDMLLKEAERPDLDLMLFHCHGTPDRQWIGGYVSEDDFRKEGDNETYSQVYSSMYAAEYDLTRYQARLAVRRQMRFGKTLEEAQDHVRKTYGLNPEATADVLDPEVVKADSLLDISTGIVLSDVHAAAPNARIVLFDACYNGDFRESDCIALRYIMGSGKTVVGLGNSVNVLQDKASSPLMGMLAAGYSVGQWQQQVAILESHIIGDPTFRFESSYGFECPNLSSRDLSYWKGYSSETYPSDIRGLALRKLSSLGADGVAELAHDIYTSTDSYTLRFECMEVADHYDSPKTRDILVKALDDPYEFVRRKASHYLGKRGEVELLPALLDEYFRDYNAVRVGFNILRAGGQFPDSLFRTSFEKRLAENEFVFDKDDFKKDAMKIVNSAESIRDLVLENLADTTLSTRRRLLFCNTFRNSPDASSADAVIARIEDNGEVEAVRVACAEMLGWYTYAWNRTAIINELSKYVEGCAEPLVAAEVRKTIARLKAYTR